LKASLGWTRHLFLRERNGALLRADGVVWKKVLDIADVVRDAW
jgi:hypothetical protein